MLKILMLFSLMSLIECGRLRHSRSAFCSQHQLRNIVRLAESVEQLHSVEFTVTLPNSRRRRHHVTDIEGDVFKFYNLMSHRLSKISADLSLMPMARFRPVYKTIAVMTELMDDEILSSGNALQRHVREIPHPAEGALNLDIVRERITLNLARVIQSIFSVGSQCFP